MPGPRWKGIPTMARARDESILVAREAFFYEGGHVPKGTTARTGHPIIKGRESLFSPIEVDYEIEAPANVIGAAIGRVSEKKAGDR